MRLFYFLTALMAILDITQHTLSIINTQNMVTDMCCYFVTDIAQDEVAVEVISLLSETTSLCLYCVIIYTMYKLRIALSLVTDRTF